MISKNEIVEMEKLISKIKNIFSRRDEMQENNIKPKYYSDDGSKIICQYCLKEMKMITITHLSKHDMTFDDYKIKYPDAPTRIKQSSVKKDNSSTVIDMRDLSRSKNIIQETKKLKSKVDDYSGLKIDRPSDDNLELKSIDSVYKTLRKIFPNIQKNYIFKKLNRDGNILYTVMTDFGDVKKRIMIDFGGMNWNVKTPLLTKSRKKELLSESKWKYINIDAKTITANDIKNILK